MVLAMAIVVLEMVAAMLECIVVLVLDFPSRTSAHGDLGDVFTIDG